MHRPLDNPPDAAVARLSLVDELAMVLAHADGRSVKFGEIVDVLRERGMALVILIITLPFVVPVPTLGLSTPAGILVVVYGVSICLNRAPWLPRFIADRAISYTVLARAVGVGIIIGRRVERLLKPRLKFMLWPGIDMLIGLSLAFCGFFLALPIPIPFTNAIPAVAILLLLLGLLKRDGVFVLGGQIASLLILGAFVGSLLMLHEYGWEAMRAMIAVGTGAGTPAPATQSLSIN